MIGEAKMNALVTINQKEVPTTTSLLVAKKFGKKHKTVLRAIEELDCSESFSWHNFVPRKYKNRGKDYPYYEITRDGFSFLCMGFTGKKAAAWKEKYIKAFNRMEKELRQIREERLSSEWNLARIDGKLQHRKFTDAIQPFVIYALNQGCKGTARNAYINFTKLINKAAGVKAGERDSLTDDMLRRIAHLENIVELKVYGLIKAGVFCKEIYKQCKTMLQNFVEMVPYVGKVYLPKGHEQLQLEAA